MPGRYRDHITPDEYVESVEEGIARMEAAMPNPVETAAERALRTEPDPRIGATFEER